MMVRQHIERCGVNERLSAAWLEWRPFKKFGRFTVIQSWLDAPAAVIFLVLLVLYGVTAAGIVVICHGSQNPPVRRFEGIVSPFFDSVAVLFALMAGFLAADIAERNKQAVQAVQVEAAELRNVFTLSVASTTDMSAIRAAWADYVKAVTGDEWQAMTRRERAPAADKAFDALLRELSAPAIGRDAGNAVHVGLLNAAIRVSSARSDRLSLASDTTSGLKWAAVLLLGMMTQISIGAVHLTKRNAQIGALTIFSAAAVIALGLIALQEHPFAGAIHLGAEPLVELLKLQGPNGGG
jgi:hypothetical protein